MRRIAVLFSLFFVSISSQADVFKCKQTDDSILFSDKPCASNKPSKNIKLDYNGSTIYLSTTEEAVPLPNGLVTDFLGRIQKACLDKSGENLLDQFSDRMRNKVKSQVESDNAIFTSVAYICDEVNNINKEIEIGKGQIFFASKMSYRSTVLCLYQADKGLDNCIGNTKIIAEDNQLKLNGY